MQRCYLKELSFYRRYIMGCFIIDNDASWIELFYCLIFKMLNKRFSLRRKNKAFVFVISIPEGLDTQNISRNADMALVLVSKSIYSVKFLKYFLNIFYSPEIYQFKQEFSIILCCYFMLCTQFFPVIYLTIRCKR